ncbi:MAG: alpha/beta fold hydrolase [Bacteroidota bacterium]|nr:alpha/beta fold hydrolase [Bacteroidota bacterium]
MELAYKKYADHSNHLVIIHGLFGTADNWHSMATKYAVNTTVWAIDLRNHGKSAHHPLATYQDMATDVAKFIKVVIGKPSSVLGHSMGGKTAMVLASQDPELIEKLIVADIAPKKYDGSHNELMDAMKNLDVTAITSRTDAEEALKIDVPNFGIRQFLLKNLTRTDAGTYKWKLNLPAIENHYDDIIGWPSDIDLKFIKSTLFVSGADSNYILPTDHEQIKSYFPNSTFAIVPNAGHWVHADNPDGFYQATIDFVKG